MRSAFAAVVAVAALAVLAPAASAAPSPPFESAAKIDSELFEARTALLLSEQPDVPLATTAGRVSGPFERALRRDAPAQLRELNAALRQAQVAFAAGDEVALASARGTALAAMRQGAFLVTVAAVKRGDLDTARSWLLIRDFRQTTRYSRPSANATAAIERLAEGKISVGKAVAAIRKDLLDAYQARMNTSLDDATDAADRGFDAKLAESGALAFGYWKILRPVYLTEIGANEERTAETHFEDLARAARTSNAAAFDAAKASIDTDLDGFVAAPLTSEEQVRRANQLTRFLDLIPIEYDHGTEDDTVTLPFEIQEGVAFQEGASQAFDDLKSILKPEHPQEVEQIEADLAKLGVYLDDAADGTKVVSLDEVEATHDAASEELDAIVPDEWKESSDDADYDLVGISLDQMEAAVAARAPEQAEQARLSAYAFFEFGPEPKLLAFDPNLTAEIEGLVWYGADGHKGLAQLIADNASPEEVSETRVALDEKLADARAKTGDGASDTTVITNAALIVFREGLEAILILVAITASLIGDRRRLRKPIYSGSLAALPVTAALFLASILVLDSLSKYGEKLEAIVGVIAVGVLLVVMNWFFHRVYWTEWIAGHRKRGKSLASEVSVGSAVATGTVAGLFVLGFTSVFREGFETVLFLQALQLSSGTGVVLAGVGLAAIGLAAVGWATFKLESKLPYKKMLIVTGAMIALVLVVMVGNTMRTMQGVGWIPITPVDFETPLWMGTWLGVFPTVETLGAQFLAFCFVIGSYFAAEYVRKRNIRRGVAEYEAAEAAGNANGAGGEDLVVATHNGGGSGNGSGNGHLNGHDRRVTSRSD